jgi:GT2 family glycosyltransferase
VIAVVVPTRNRAERLRALLAGLAAQEGAELEAVVVDDGSTDHTQDVLADPPPGLRLRSLRLDPSRGAAAARNAGWRATEAELVAFTDDDCMPAPGWLTALARAHAERPEALLQGRTEPLPEEEPGQNAFSLSQLQTSLGPNFQTCNVAYPRAALERAGGFDESFAHYAEDADLAWRAQKQGTPALWVDDALVQHAVHQVGALALARDAWRWSDGVRAWKRHPEMRRHFRLGIFWKPEHERLLYALAGAALARRTRGLSLLAVLPYVQRLRRLHGSYPGTVASLPAHVLVDTAELLAVARGAVRFRALVL